MSIKFSSEQCADVIIFDEKISKLSNFACSMIEDVGTDTVCITCTDKFSLTAADFLRKILTLNYDKIVSFNNKVKEDKLISYSIMNSTPYSFSNEDMAIFEEIKNSAENSSYKHDLLCQLMNLSNFLNIEYATLYFGKYFAKHILNGKTTEEMSEALCLKV